MIDFFYKCDECDGSGTIINPAWPEWYEKNKEVMTSDPPERVKCPHCHGTGRYPNAAGEELINILEVAQAHIEGRAKD